MTSSEEVFTCDITALATGGDGLGRVDGRVCFVPFAYPGDRVRARVVRRTPKAWWGALEAVETPSPDRIPCLEGKTEADAAYVWGGLAYDAQTVWKRRIVADCLARIGKIAVEVEWVGDPASRHGYRTRAEFHGDGRRLGYFAPGTREIVSVKSCPLCHDAVNAVLAELGPARLKGSVTVTAHPETGETMLWAPPGAGPYLSRRFANVNAPRDPRPRARLEVDGVPVVNGTFCQSSLTLNRLLVGTVREMAGACGSLLDLYCGNGNLSLGLARAGVRVTGMDHAGAAVRAAAETGAGDYRTGDEAAMGALMAAGRWDTVVLDPPRAGAAAVVEGAAAAAQARIVCVSCDPATLARDLAAFAGLGWRVKRAVALDLFPCTPHVETACLLERD
ncbi:MAG TPA: hypothetical protein PL005_15630 [Candidatus Hydrogenedentes bacterium]|nr:hypothetical protein [Candidatus Hydrogenedentota bacterium]